MERRLSHVAATLALLSITATASAQFLHNPAPPRQGTLSGKLDQLSRSLMGNSTEASPNNGNRTGATSKRPTVNSPNTSSQPSRPEVMASRPAAPATANSSPSVESNSAASSSRRTAQPGYRSSTAQPATAGSSTAAAGSTASGARPSSGAMNQEPRTLQEALLSARRPTTNSSSNTAAAPTQSAPKTTSSSTTSSSPTTSSSTTAKSTSPTPRIEASKPAPPARTVRRPDVEETTAKADEPAEVEKPRATTAPARPLGEAILVTQKSPMLSVETSGPRRMVVGSEGRYKIVILNTSDVAARDVELSIDLPEHAEVVGAEGSKGDARLPADNEGPGLYWTLDQLGPRGREELSVRIVPRKNEAFGMAVQWSHAPALAQVQVDVQEPKLTMALTGPKEVAFGEKVIFKLTFANPGNADADNVVVKLLPIGAADGPMDSHTIGNIKAGESKVVEMELIARQTGHLSIKAEANAAGGLRAYLNEEVLVRRADLKVDIEAPKFQYARTVVNYKVHVSNPGNATASDIQVAAQMPARATYVSSTGGGQIDADGTRVVWNVRSLPPGEEQVLQFRCQLEAAGVNRLQVVSTSGDLQHTASAITEVEALADLVLNVIEPEGAFPVGEEVSYEVRIKNRGTKSADGVDVLAFFSNGIEAVSASGGKHEITPGKVAFQTIPNIGAGKELVLRIKAKAESAGNHVFRAEVYCKSLGTKLGEEGTTRFFGDDVGDNTIGGQPTPAAKPTADRASSLRGGDLRYGNTGSRIESSEPSATRYSGSTRYRGVAPPASVDEAASSEEPLKPIPQERD